MGFIKEFKEFAVKGNVMDMAVGRLWDLSKNSKSLPLRAM